ncbi:hypothetical protein [Castellaniella sp. UC4442_H9]
MTIMTTKQQPRIFTVHVFRPIDDECVRLDVHYVAAFTSADAELRIKATGAESLEPGRRFISTDEITEAYDHTTRMYATQYRNEKSISVQEFQRWVAIATQRQWCDGEPNLIPFREF